MSVLGKYRKDEERRDDDDRSTTVDEATPVAIPNNERKSPIMSFSVTTELRSCLKAIRNEKAINLSMWVEHKLRDALTEEFPEIAKTYF